MKKFNLWLSGVLASLCLVNIWNSDWASSLIIGIISLGFLFMGLEE